MKIFIEIFFVLLFIILINLSSSNEGPTIITSSGRVKGYYRVSQKGNKYEAYEGIPFAQPPVGFNRFEPPIPVKAWKDVLRVNKLREKCWGYRQISIDREDHFSGVEDCLYLNIYVPEKKFIQPLPVIVYFYGGSFMFSTLNGNEPHHLIDHDVIFVTLNHRHGVLGFLSTEDDIVPGNMGLKDQSVAIRWISDNIRHFGGDPSKITLIGFSSGAASVHYHYLSPMTTGLFRNGISLSGTAFNPRAQAKNVRKNAIKLGEMLNCPTKNMSLMIECFKKLPAETLVKAQIQFMPWKLPNIPFGPVVEKHSTNAFIDKSPIEIITNGKAYNAPWITGVVSEEGLHPVAEFGLNSSAMKLVDINWKSIAPILLNYYDTIPKSEHDITSQKIRNHYLANNPIDRKNLQSLVQLVGDRMFVVDAVRAAKAMAKANQSPVRFYYYPYRAVTSTSVILSKSNENLGVRHSDDLFLFLGDTLFISNATKDDLEMHKVLVKLWTSFARTGTPELEVNWQKVEVNNTNLQYLQISEPKNLEMKTSSNFAQYKFWNSINFNENKINT